MTDARPWRRTSGPWGTALMEGKQSRKVRQQRLDCGGLHTARGEGAGNGGGSQEPGNGALPESAE